MLSRVFKSRSFLADGNIHCAKFSLARPTCTLSPLDAVIPGGQMLRLGAQRALVAEKQRTILPLQDLGVLSARPFD